jgi:hypothetical protein
MRRKSTAHIILHKSGSVCLCSTDTIETTSKICLNHRLLTSHLCYLHFIETLTLKWFFKGIRQQFVSVHWNETNTHPHELGFSLLCPSLNLNRCYIRSSHLRNSWNVTRKRGKFARHVQSWVIIHTWTVRISVIS